MNRPHRSEHVTRVFTDVTQGYRFKPAPNVPRRSVQCKECGAEIGQPCVRPDGSARDHVHKSRLVQSTRKYNAERAMDTVELPPEVQP